MKPKEIKKQIIALLSEKPGSEATIKPTFLVWLKSELERQKNRNTVKIVSVHQLPEATKLLIKKIIAAPVDSPETTVIDKDIIAGFIAEYNDRVFDASLKTQLQSLRSELKKEIS